MLTNNTDFLPSKIFDMHGLGHARPMGRYHFYPIKRQEVMNDAKAFH